MSSKLLEMTRSRHKESILLRIFFFVNCYSSFFSLCSLRLFVPLLHSKLSQCFRIISYICTCIMRIEQKTKTTSTRRVSSSVHSHSSIHCEFLLWCFRKKWIEYGRKLKGISNFQIPSFSFIPHSSIFFAFSAFDSNSHSSSINVSLLCLSNVLQTSVFTLFFSRALLSLFGL